MMKRKRGDTPGFPTAPPPKGFSRRVPSFSLPSRPGFFSGVLSIAQIEALFMHSPRIAPAPRRSADEDRLIAVGRTSAGRPVFVAFTIRTKGKRRLIRPVTARYMHFKEIEAYEKAFSFRLNPGFIIGASLY
jgi:uncharacterized DUF497 family protein